MIIKKWLDKKRKQKDYKGFVGNPNKYDEIGMIIFEKLKQLGLKEEHKFLDIGCGSLRVGRFLIPFLNKKNYFGLEPEKWLVNYSINLLLCQDIIKQKDPAFLNDIDFNLEKFNQKFDFMLANSIFIHASKKQIEKCFDQISKVLNNGGSFLFNFILGKKDNEHKNWTYPSDVKYTKDFFEKIINKYKYMTMTEVECKYPGKQIFIFVKYYKEGSKNVKERIDS